MTPSDTNPRLVMVQWVDSAQPQSHWQWLEDYEADEAFLVETVGWLLADGDVLGVAQTLGGRGDLAEQTMGIIHIPRQCVSNIIQIYTQGDVDDAIAAGTRSAETNEDLAQSEGCQSGVSASERNAQNTPSRPSETNLG